MKEMKASSVKRKLLLWVFFWRAISSICRRKRAERRKRKNGGRIFAGRQRIHE